MCEFIARTLAPMLYPRKARGDDRYRFFYQVRSNIPNADPINVQSTALSDQTSWTDYQNIFQTYVSLSQRDDVYKRDLNSISSILWARMEDLRITFFGLPEEEREAFHTITKDLLPVTKGVTMEELGGNPDAVVALCTVCGLPFSQQLQEPSTPPGGTSAATPSVAADGGLIHNPICCQKCAFLPQSHAFCLRGWSRFLMARDANSRVIGIKNKEQWRCSTCFVDPWRVG